MVYKTIAFAIGCSMAAAAGAFQCHYFSQINPQAFGIFIMMNYLIFVVVGGTKKLVGPFVGAFTLTLFSEWLGLYEELLSYKPLIYSLVLILVVLFLPEGLISLPDKMTGWLKKNWRKEKDHDIAKN